MRDDFDDLVGFDDEPDESGLPWPPPPPPPPPGAAHRRGVRVAAFAGTAVVAAAAGFGVARAALDESRTSPAAASSPSSPAASSPVPSSSAAPGGGSRSLLPPGSGGVIPSTGPGQELQLDIGGEVTAVSATSITLGVGAQHVTAAITGATTVTGRVRNISGIRVGDLVSARITGADGKLTAVAIQDPARVP